jgi:hypothetical protein
MFFNCLRVIAGLVQHNRLTINRLYIYTSSAYADLIPGNKQSTALPKALAHPAGENIYLYRAF